MRRMDYPMRNSEMLKKKGILTARESVFKGLLERRPLARPTAHGFWLAAFLMGFALFPEFAYAHVKWFVSYDMICPPRAPFSVMLSHYFLELAAFVGPLMFVVAYTDRWIAHSPHFVRGKLGVMIAHPSSAGHFVGINAPSIIRYAAAVFFLTLFLYGDFILTPELKTTSYWVRWVQLAVAALALSPRTMWMASIGIAVLFAKAIDEYGVFHMLDYPIFIGVALYLFMWSRFGACTSLLADSVLRSFSGVTLLWGGIEKFAYPEWSFILLAEKPGLSFGLNPELYMIAAGFVEFCAAYLLITGRLASRAAAIVLLFFFLSAIVPFGMIDAVGHSVIIVVLVVLAFGNSNPAAPHFDFRGPCTTALAHTCVFFTALIILMGAYYGGHYLSYQT